MPKRPYWTVSVMVLALAWMLSAPADARRRGVKVGYTENGKASWYGGKFHGRKTANGETYDMHAMTAAHKSLPFNCIVIVTNLDNQKTVRVRINDRGPFVRGRIIDLSYAAGKKIGIDVTGIAPVQIKVIGKVGDGQQSTKSENSAEEKKPPEDKDSKPEKKTDPPADKTPAPKKEPDKKSEPAKADNKKTKRARTKTRTIELVPGKQPAKTKTEKTKTDETKPKADDKKVEAAPPPQEPPGDGESGLDVFVKKYRLRKGEKPDDDKKPETSHKPADTLTEKDLEKESTKPEKPKDKETAVAKPKQDKPAKETPPAEKPKADEPKTDDPPTAKPKHDYPDKKSDPPEKPKEDVKDKKETPTVKPKHDHPDKKTPPPEAPKQEAPKEKPAAPEKKEPAKVPAEDPPPAEPSEVKDLEVGYATSYGEEKHGKKGAAGVTINMYEFAAAHYNLPFGTKVRVTNQENGKQAVVVINDRCRKVDYRIIEVSDAAAKALGMSGKTKVKVEVIEAPRPE